MVCDHYDRATPLNGWLIESSRETEFTIEPLLTESNHDERKHADNNGIEPGPLHGIRVLDLTRVLGKSHLELGS